MMTLHEITLGQLEELGGVHPVLRQFAEKSSHLIAALWDRTPTCFVGLIPVDDGVYIWMQTLPATAEHPLATARHAKGLISKAKAQYGKVIGHCKDTASVRWLRSLGATFKESPGPVFYFEIV